MTDKLRQAVETAEGIVNANWRNWQELASQEEFERWVKGRSHHIATLVRQALADPREIEAAGIAEREACLAIAKAYKDEWMKGISHSAIALANVVDQIKARGE